MELKPGYKQTVVGVIPEEWGIRQLADLLEQSRSIRYGIVQPGKFDACGCLMLRSQDYSRGWTGPDEMHRVNGQVESQYKNARIGEDDLIMTIVGAGIGQVVIAPTWLDGAILSRSTARISVDNNRTSRHYVKALLESPLGKRQVLDCQKEGAQPVVSCRDLAKFFLPYPPLPEQRAIAAALSDVDALLAKLDALIAKKRDLKQAAMQQLLTGQTRLPDFDNNEDFKNTEVGVIPIDWGVSVFGDLFNIAAAGDVDPNRTKSYQDEVHCYPIYSNALTKLGLYGYCSYADHPAGSITITARGTLGFANFRDHPYSAIGRVLVLRPKTEMAGRFFTEVINNRVKFAIESTGVPQLTAPQISAYLLPVPTLPEQIAIAEVLSDMDAEISALEARRNKTRALKQGMMQELLIGRIRLV